MAFFGALFSIFFHFVVPGYIIYEIFVEMDRKNKPILGYPEKTKDSNILTMCIMLVVYIIIVVLFHRIF